MALKFSPPAKTDPPASAAVATQEPTVAQAKEPHNPLAHLGLKGTLVNVGVGRRKRSRRLDAETLFNKFWAISKPALAALVAEYQAGYEGSEEEDPEDQGTPYLLTDDGIACIPVLGPLSKSMSWRGTAYSEISGMFTHAMENSSVKSILMCIDSPGGSVSGMFECCDLMHAMSGTKPVASISDDSMYSAAYCLGSAADKVFCVPTGGVGSIGCYMAHFDISGMLKDAGVTVTLVYAGARKVDGNMYSPLSDQAQEDMQTEADRIREMFVSAVARNRSVSADALMATEAAVFMGTAGVPLLADQMGGIDDAMTYLRGRMAETPNDPDNPDNPELPEEGDDLGAGRIKNGTLLATGGTADGKVTKLSTPDGKFTMTFTTSTADLLSGHIDLTGPLAGEVNAGAIPYQKTATSDGPWDGPKAKANLKLNQTASYYRKAFAWQEGGSDGTKKGQFRYIHHEVSADGTIGAANTVACSSGIAVLNGGRSGTTIPSADRKGVYNHLAGHLKAAGKTPPPLKSEAQLEQELRQWEASDAEALAGLRAEAFGRPEVSVTLLLSPNGSEEYIPSMAAASPGYAQYEYPQAESEQLFGEPGVILAVRKMPASCLVSAPKEGTSRKISMLVVPYDGSTCNLGGGLKERYAKGCFTMGLNNDPRCLLNHDEMYVIGRKSAGTARFWESEDGVHAEADAPATTWADDMIVSLNRNDLRESSASFWILQQRFETRGDERIRVVERAILRDASVIAFSAYPTTTAGVQQAAAAASTDGLSLMKNKLRLLSI